MTKDIRSIVRPGLQEPPKIFRQKRSEYDMLSRLNPSSIVHGIRDRTADPYAVKVAFESPNTVAKRKSNQDALDRGTLAHMMILEPYRVMESVAIYEGPKRAGDDWIAFNEANHGKLIVRRVDYDEVNIGAAVAATNPRIRQLLSDCDIETTLTWNEGTVGCKGLVDAVQRTPSPLGLLAIPDIKTTERGIDNHSCQQTIRQLHYREKMAMYRRAASMVYGIPTENIRPHLIFVSLTPPFGVNIVQLGSGGLDWAEERMLRVVNAVEIAVHENRFMPLLTESAFGLTGWEANEDENMEWGGAT